MHKKIKVGRSVLETITVALYENPIILFREYVQNSLDAYNRATIDEGKEEVMSFHVSINIDEHSKNIVIKDIGYGVESYELFQEKMLSIGGSDKGSDRTKYIGFRGIGRISGLAFCERLIFRNKVKNSDKIHECVWEGKKYRDLLSDENTEDNLESIIEKIVTNEEKVTTNKIEEHFFEVTLENYTNEITEILGDRNFKEKLIKMLPLKYENNFEGAKKILSKYNTFMNINLERFMIPVKYQGKNLYKKYDNDYILGSDIIFWEIRDKKNKDGSKGAKIGILWFTFDKHLKTINKDEYYGILTRSKNILMGSNDTFAQVANNNKEYISTFREMAQTLRGVCGELLINSQDLRDNSRRDWFLPDQYSIYLNNVITEFMRRLHKYRYCASRYFRDKPLQKKEDLKEALDELVNIKDNQIDYDYFYEKKAEKKTDNNLLSEQDIPYESKSMKKYYNILMKIIEEYFDKENKRILFLKLRAYLANHFKK